MEAIKLTEGAASFLAAHVPPEQGSPQQLVMQVCDLRPVATSSQQNPIKEQRFRMALSDGHFLQQGMLATQRNQMVVSGNLLKGSIVKLTQYTCNFIQGRIIVIVVDLEVILKDCNIIGAPRPLVSRTDGNISSNKKSPTLDLPASLGGNHPSYGGSAAGTGNASSYVDSAVGCGDAPSYGGSAVGRGDAPSYGGSAVSRGDAPSYGVSAVSGGSDAGVCNPPLYGGSGAGGGNPPSYGGSGVSSGNPPFYGGSAVSGGNPPSYGGSAAGGGNPPLYGGSAAGGGSPQSYGSSASRPSVAGSLVTENMNSGRYNTTDAAPRHPRTDYSSAVSRNLVNNHARPPHASFLQHDNRGPLGKHEAAQRTIPIAALNPYQGRWTIKARVTSKTEMRYYSNNKGPGNVFSFDLLDSDGGEIRVTCFNVVADHFYTQIMFGKVYMITKGTLKPARKDFNHLGHGYEITLDSTSLVQLCSDEDKSIPQLQFHFRTISEIESLGNNNVVDVIGIVSSIFPAITIQKKDGTQTQKRSLHLKDMSGKSVELTMWGNFCNNEGSELQTLCDSGKFPVLVVKSAKVNDFNGKSIGTISSSQLMIDPKSSEAKKLREWFDSVGKITPTVLITKESRAEHCKTLSQIKDEKIGTSNKPDWVTVSATVVFIKLDNFFYTACPLTRLERQCNKKLIDTGDGKWRCDACGQPVVECDYRYILQIQIQDHTGSTYVTAFQEGGQEIMGVSAKDMYFMKCEEHDNDKFSELIKSVLFTKFIFKLKVTEVVYLDENRVKSTVIKAEKINSESESKKMLEFIANPNKVEDSDAVQPRAENVTSTPGLSPSGYAQAPYNGNTNRMARETAIHASQISGGAYGNQYSGGASRPSYVSCNSCGSMGHTEAECPSLMSGPAQYSEASQPHFTRDDIPATGNAYGSNTGGGECYKCHQFGHFAKECPSSRDARPAYGGGGSASNECFRCHQSGHYANACPNVGSNTGGYGRAPNQRVGGY